MAIPRTSLLDLPLPVTGSLSGDWGAATNNGLTEYLDIAVAGSLVLNTDADVTLTSTDGDENGTNIGSTTAQYAILRWTATGSTTRNITVPAKSKTYIVINATGGTQSIVLRGAGPTTGVTIVAGERAVCAWNGSDFVKVGGAAGGSNTQVQYNNNGVFGGSADLTWDGSTLATTGLTASGAVTLSATSQNIALGTSQVGGTWTAGGASQTGAITLDQSTKTHTLNIGTGATENALTKTINLGTAGVSGSTTAINIGSAVSGATTNVTLNGTVQPGVVISGSSSGDALRITQTGTGNALLVEDAANPDSSPFVVTAAGDVGIGTSSPGVKLDVTASGATVANFNRTTSNGKTLDIQLLSQSVGWLGSNGNGDLVISSTSGGLASNQMVFAINGTTNMRLDSSGNLGLGVTPPNATIRTINVARAASGIQGFTSGSFYNTANAFWASAGWTYGSNGNAFAYGLDLTSNSHQWFTAPSGTANTVITFTQAMTLDASGNLGIGTTSPGSRLQVLSGTATGATFASNQYIRVDGSSGASYSAGVASTGNTTSGYYISTAANSYEGGMDYEGTNKFMTFRTNNTERARITSGGDLGVGASSPNGRVESKTAAVVSGDSAYAKKAFVANIPLSTSNVTSSLVAAFDTTVHGADIGYSYDGTGYYLAFATNSTVSGSPTERARITRGGYFKASDNGTYQNSTGSFHEFYQTANSVALDVKATNASYNQSVCFLRTDRAANSAFQFLFCNANGVGQFYVRGDGTIYAQNTTVQSISDVRVKENIRNSSDGLNVINAIRPVRFDFKPGFGNDRKNQLGFIAQEIETVFPDAVENISLSDEKDEPYKSVGPGALIPVLVKAIQEQQALITSLTARVAALEGTQP